MTVFRGMVIYPTSNYFICDCGKFSRARTGRRCGLRQKLCRQERERRARRA